MAIEIFVKGAVDNQECRIQVSPSETFLQVKKKIKEKTNIEVDDQVLKFNGLEVTDDNYTIEFYEIEDGMMIELVTINQPNHNNNNIRSSPPTNSLPHNLTLDQYIEISAIGGYTTVAQLKAKVQQMTQAPASRLRLFFRGRELTDDLRVSTEFVKEDEPIELILVS